MSHDIGIDTRMLRHTGIGTYIRELVAGLIRSGITSHKDFFLFGASEEGDKLRWGPFKAPIYSIREQLEYPVHVSQCKLWHAPHYNIPLFPGKTRLVVTIHDLIHWIFRKQFFGPLQEFYAGRMLRCSVKKAAHIITVSEATRKDLIDHFQADPERISVIYEAVDKDFKVLDDTQTLQRIKAKYELPDKYFLFVGGLRPHKNVLWLVRLFRRLRIQGRTAAKLVLVGQKLNKYPKEYRYLSRLRTGGGIVHIPSAEREELIALYNGALALVHPSLYEGFGLTVLEAMACGTPVITLKTASIPEVAGDAAYYVDPVNAGSMQDAIVKVEENAQLRNELKEKGFQRIKQFSWDRMASETADVYQKVLMQS